MKLPLLLLILLISMRSIAAQEGPARKPAYVRLDGGFIQYQSSMLRLDTRAWRKELEAMHVARMNLIVLQWLKTNNTEFIPADSNLPVTDPTRVILDYADEHNMRVFIGLSFDDGWWNGWDKADYLDGAAADCLAIAKRAWARYGSHPAFAGWYVPQETSNGPYNEKQISQLRTFFHRVSIGCKALSNNKPLAASPFFTQAVKPETVEQEYSELLKAAGIDILLLQDGVGANGWDDDVAGQVVPYFRALRNACRAAGVELWSDLESFRIVDNQSSGFIPADAARIGRQLTAEAPFVRRFITFDFFHYMSPLRGPAQKKLYSDYINTVNSADKR